MDKQCTRCSNVFTITSSDQDFYGRMQVPEPTLCPNCRLQRRYNMRNERVLYRRQCDLTGVPIVTIFAPDSPYTVYSQDAWWSDQWDQFKFGREVDFTKPVFEQMKALQLQQPRLALLAKDSENSEYTNHSAFNKNCYLGFSVIHSEDVLYGYLNFKCYTLVDCSYMFDNSQLCYESFYCHSNYGCAYATLCRGCTDVWFSFDLSGCESCFLCWNLRNKKYCFLNEQLSKEAYKRRVAEYKNMSYQQQQDLIGQWRDLIATKAIHQASNQVNVSASTGNFLAKCHDVTEGYYVSGSENCRYIVQGENMKDCMDACNVAPAEFCYEIQAVINDNHCKFVNYSYDNSFLEYCDHVFNSQHLFACVGLNRQKFCILNTQYTEPEYQRLKKKMIEYMKSTGEYGEFFPLPYSPFAYNETVAHDFFPLTKDKAQAIGVRWNDSLDILPQVTGIPAATLPNTIAEVTDDILHQNLICSVSDKPYKIMPTELCMYRQLGIPLPRKHPEVRFQERMTQRVAPRLYRRQCSRCQKEVQSSFDSNRPEQIYCETCYQKEVY